MNDVGWYSLSYAQLCFCFEVASNKNRRLGPASSFLMAGGLGNTESLRMASKYAEREHLSKAALHLGIERGPCK